MEGEKISPKYILIQSDRTLSYDDNNCYLNDRPVETILDPKPSHKDLCYQMQKSFYDSFLKKHFKNVVILAAAGTSMDNGDSNTSGKTRTGLWSFCQTEIDAFSDSISEYKKKEFYIKKDIEGLLSYIILYEKLNGEIKKGESILRAALEAKIAKACKLNLQPQAPHIDFLNKLTARKTNDPRVKLFTTNYDLLFEMAANQSGFVVIDGFSFTHPRKFSGRYFDLDIVNREKTRVKQEESFASKVFHLYKMHGSLNWFKDVSNNNIVQQDEPTKPLIIYPANEKYESSYEQPYFEMMSRFQQALRKETTLLIVIGFGFQDKHIQNVIIEAVEQNPSFQLLIVNYSGQEDRGIDTAGLSAFFVDEEKKQIKRNVNIVYDSFSSFTKKYPTNNTYIEATKEAGNESL
ncbi:SIR2 family protein [Agriterribacter sp.]|uniref:SIR2 family protein n=1 Tax=Agriterribacter sp. TaxID=2821509 RepID=UPI002C83FBC4|nr:SIR2 family protein [Agriterribacter sp.]HRO44824.1 SIR2 family protein [Agriterribacter sp.]HRQ18044.1 SIR2 family protein [Agriterribacter sp.]